MIKFNSEKQDEMIYHLKILHREVSNFISQTKQEFTFVREVLTEFETINADYSKRLDSLIKDVRRKNEEIILSKPGKLDFEQKTKYATVLEFTFIEFENYFRRLKKNLEASWPTDSFGLMQSLAEYEASSLAELQKLNKRLNKDLQIIQKHRTSFKQRKDKYFDNVQEFKVNALVEIQNMKSYSSPGAFTRIQPTARP